LNETGVSVYALACDVNRSTYVPGFSRRAGPFVALAVRRANRNDLTALKARLETPG